MWNKIKVLLGKKKTSVALDNDGKIEFLRQQVEGVFSEFKNMHDKLERFNHNLNNIAEEEKALVIQAEKRAQKALDEIEMNNKLKEKLKDFIV